jgi:cell division protein FtsL
MLESAEKHASGLLGKFLIFWFAVFFFVGPLSADDDLQIQILNNEIADLRQKIAGESDELESCAKKVKGFKIAGGVTLGLTAVGVGVNVYQAVGRNETKKSISEVDEKLEDAKKQLAKLQEEIAASKMMDDPEALRKINPESLNEGNKAVAAKILRTLENRVEQLRVLGGECKDECADFIRTATDAILQWRSI